MDQTAFELAESSVTAFAIQRLQGIINFQRTRPKPQRNIRQVVITQVNKHQHPSPGPERKTAHCRMAGLNDMVSHTAAPDGAAARLDRGKKKAMSAADLRIDITASKMDR
jgi:hypothetical protein